jgi:sister-chromatid-cohesion protein PDS5
MVSKGKSSSSTSTDAVASSKGLKSSVKASAAPAATSSTLVSKSAPTKSDQNDARVAKDAKDVGSTKENVPTRTNSSVGAPLTAGFLKPNMKKGELLTNLQVLFNHLQTLAQETGYQPPSELRRNVAPQLISDKLVKHSDKEVRLLTACCFVELLRIYAPDDEVEIVSPFSDEEMLIIFDLLIAQLRSLALVDVTKGTGQNVLHILTSLATVKSCLIPAALASQGLAEADEILHSLLEVLLTSIHPDHPETGRGNYFLIVAMLSYLIISVSHFIVAIFEECLRPFETDRHKRGTVDQRYVELLLQQLLPASKTENPTVTKLAQSIIRQCGDSLAEPMGQFFNRALSVDGHTVDSELSSHIYVLIYETHKLYPPLMMTVIPSICSHLAAEDEDIRLRACKLLGRLFASEFAEYGRDFSKDFKIYLARFHDTSVRVRHEMVEFSGVIIKNKPNLCIFIEGEL